MPKIATFEELRVYQESCELDLRIFALTKSFPSEERYALTDQVRRSSRSIGANIAEAWAKRRYPAHFLSKLSDADGELQETRHWINRSLAYGYLSPTVHAELGDRCAEIGRKLGTMMQNPAGFV